MTSKFASVISFVCAISFTAHKTTKCQDLHLPVCSQFCLLFRR